MKQHHPLYPRATSLLACALLLLQLASCTQDTPGEPPGITGQPLTISVSDGGMYATGQQTRAEERGYRTVFTEGDRIGLYVVNDDGTQAVQNLCLTLQAGKWTLPPGAPQLLYSPGKSFYAYYPYQNDMTDKVSPGNEDFFKPLVDYWRVNVNQSTYADYTASDLMTARGVYSNHTLSFAMEHRMAMVILEFPVTKYNYTEQIDGRETSKSYYGYTMIYSPLLSESPYTGRFLVNTHLLRYHGLELPVQYYSNGNKKETIVRSEFLNLQPGRYTIHKVDGGAVTEKDRPLREGDFYMKDGSILPQEDVAGEMSRQDKEGCLGVVFWVGTHEGEHWTESAPDQGDHLLMRDHPECTRGMVVALRDASPGAQWATGLGANEHLWTWCDSFRGFTPEEKADWKKITDSKTSYGYSSSRLIKLYETYHADTTFPANDAIAPYAVANPAPQGSSGWFFPGQFELAMMCYGKTKYYESRPTARRDLLNSLFQKAGGEAFAEERYWSNVAPIDEVAWSIDFAGPTAYGAQPKSNSHRVRAVLAF